LEELGAEMGGFAVDEKEDSAAAQQKKQQQKQLKCHRSLRANGGCEEETWQQI